MQSLTRGLPLPEMLVPRSLIHCSSARLKDWIRLEGRSGSLHKHMQTIAFEQIQCHATQDSIAHTISLVPNFERKTFSLTFSEAKTDRGLDIGRLET